MELEQICQGAKAASQKLATLGTNEKNRALTAVASALVAASADIIAANKEDLENGKKNHMPEGLLDRLMLNEARIAQIAEGLQQVAALDDPIGEVLSMKKRPNGLMIGKKRVPLGVVGMIYEARPNVTVDAFGLCFKTGNAVILKGGSDAIHSNIAIVSVIQKTLEQLGIPKEAASLIEDTSRDTAAAFMKMNQYVDVLIPRGGAGLIRAVVNQATIPVIETGTGNCHIYIDKDADLSMGVEILFNAKTSRPSVCNAAESLLVHKDVAEAFLPMAKQRLDEKQVQWRGCKRVQEILGKDVLPATPEDYGTEFLDYILSAKVVDSLDEAIEHITKYGTKHSEAIVTENLRASEEFTSRVDAAAVYVNASTRFTDGGEFGLGAEIGISTQKLHARGPMGLKELTTVKYIINGQGQVR